jgi:hypothetical protein
MSRPQYRCDTCHQIDEFPIEVAEDLEFHSMGDQTVTQRTTRLACSHCDGDCDEISVCVECDYREQHDGCEVCFECLIESCIEDPAEIETCSRSLQVEIAKELVRRLRPRLSVPQAGLPTRDAA